MDNYRAERNRSGSWSVVAIPNVPVKSFTELEARTIAATLNRMDRETLDWGEDKFDAAIKSLIDAEKIAP